MLIFFLIENLAKARRHRRFSGLLPADSAYRRCLCFWKKFLKKGGEKDERAIQTSVQKKKG